MDRIIYNLSIGLTWVLVYRTEKFQKLKCEIEKQSKKCKNHDVLAAGGRLLLWTI